MLKILQNHSFWNGQAYHVTDQFIVHICPFPDLSNAPTDMKSEYSYWMLLCPGDWRSLRGCRQKTAVTIFHHHHHHHHLRHHHHCHHHHYCHYHHHHHHHAVLSRQREVPEEVSTEDCGHNVSSLKIGWVSSYLSSCTSASANMPQNRAGRVTVPGWVHICPFLSFVTLGALW